MAWIGAQEGNLRLAQVGENGWAPLFVDGPGLGTKMVVVWADSFCDSG